MKNQRNNNQTELIRVLQCTGALNVGGAETMIMNIYRKIDKSKIQFDYLVVGNEKGYFEEEAVAMGAKVFHITPRSVSFLKNLNDFYRVVNNGKYRIVHFHTQNAFLTFIQLCVAKFAGAKIIIVHSHSTSDWRSGMLKKMHFVFRPLLSRSANIKLSCGKEAAMWLYGNDKGVRIIPLPVLCEKYKYNEEKYYNLRKEYGYDDFIIFTHTGRFYKPKNHEFLIDIFAEISKKKPNAILFLIGDGELKEQIKNKVKELHLEGKVIFWGNISDVWNKLIMSDAFLFPSLYEGFPTAVLEAQAAGLPCYISDTITPQIAETKNVKQLSLNKNAIEWCEFILSDMEHGKANRASTNKAISEKYDISKVKDIFTELYSHWS